MDDGISIGSHSSSSKMGASSNPNASRLSALHERKKVIEETLAKRNQELKQLCIQEAELTGILPPEIPLEPGESPPTFRRRIGTSFQLPQNLLNNINNEEESIAKLELEMQVQSKLADAAFLLADERNISKTVRRKHKAEYEKHKKQYDACQEKLQFLKTTVQATQNNQQKQKKKPRPVEKDDTVSMHTNLSEPLGKSTLRHSMRSLQHPMISDSSTEQREYNKLRATYSNSNPHCNTISQYMSHNMTMFYRLSLNDYKNYVERRESADLPDNVAHQQNYLPYTSSYSPQSSTQYNTIHSSSPNHLLQRATIPSNYNNSNNYHYATMPQQQHIHDYKSKLNLNNAQAAQLQRQSSGNNMHNHKNYYPMTPTYRQYTEQQYNTLNPHQLQPHQQYEHVMTTGLGGVWKQSETGEFVWCNSVPNMESPWQGDKVFGSLDRRRNKRMHKKISPSTEQKVDTPPTYNERIRTISSKPQVLTRRQEKLVRTQSLGSVGAQTADSVWPSDDNSSCEIDMHNDMGSLNRKPKQKEWYETALDGPSKSQTPTNLLTVLAPEEKYSPPPLPPPNVPIMASPQTPKPLLEIPAESNPSPRIQETHMEMFNNNIPKNCTVVHAGQCKPYHEETKPFEMSDFYKYSTKFKKSNNDTQTLGKSWSPNHKPHFNKLTSTPDLPSPSNMPDNVDDDAASVIQKGIYQPLQPMKCQPYSPMNHSHEINSPHQIGSPMGLNASLDFSQLTPSVAENFSAEMNAWYQNHEHQMDNNNAPVPASKIRTTAATLV